MRAAAARALSATLLAGAAGLAAAGPARAACELVLVEDRSGRELARLPLPRAAPEFEIAFTHSVLRTPVIDRYAWRRGAWVLVEERFAGHGYGLPDAPGGGERLERMDEAGRTRDGEPSMPASRLVTQRRVDPLVVRAVPEAAMRLRLRGQVERGLTGLGRGGIRFVTSSACRPGQG